MIRLIVLVDATGGHKSVLCYRARWHMMAAGSQEQYWQFLPGGSPSYVQDPDWFNDFASILRSWNEKWKSSVAHVSEVFPAFLPAKASLGFEVHIVAEIKARKIFPLHYNAAIWYFS